MYGWSVATEPEAPEARFVLLQKNTRSQQRPGRKRNDARPACRGAGEVNSGRDVGWRLLRNAPAKFTALRKRGWMEKEGTPHAPVLSCRQAGGAGRRAAPPELQNSRRATEGSTAVTPPRALQDPGWQWQLSRSDLFLSANKERGRPDDALRCVFWDDLTQRI